jgi:hypothetical protein
MRILLLILLMTNSIFGSANCYSVKERDKRWACYDKLSAIEYRIKVTKPTRKSGPLREINLNDIEVREIQESVANVLPKAIVNISGVTVGCPCEDGAGCKDEVWLVASTSTLAKELKLSKIKDHWTIGPIQQWWLMYENFLARRADYKSPSNNYFAEEDIKMEFPACLTQQ